MKFNTSFLGSSVLGAVVVALLTFGTSTANANVTVFEQLRGLFETGSMPADTDLVGWRTGRCYHADTPHRPRNGMIAGWLTQGPDHGPIGRGTQTLRTLPVYWANGAPGIFDEPSPQVVQSVENFLDREAPLVARAQYDERTVYGTYIDRFEQQWAMRKSTSFQLTQPRPGPTTQPTEEPVPEPMPGPTPEPTPGPTQDYIVARMTRNGYVVQYCYYFKVIR